MMWLFREREINTFKNNNPDSLQTMLLLITDISVNEWTTFDRFLYIYVNH